MQMKHWPGVNNNVADIFTKYLPFERWVKHVCYILNIPEGSFTTRSA